MNQYRRIFISHAHADNMFCSQLHQTLTQRGIDAWIDLHNLQDGHFLSQEIQDELQQRPAFILIMSSASLASFWVKLETEAYFGLMAKDRTRILISVRVDRCDVPPFMNALKWIDAVGRPVQDVADEMMRALLVASGPSVQPVAPDLAGESAPIPARLAQLGFMSRQRNGVACIIPPTVTIAGGSFTMGSDKTTDPQARDDETPPSMIQIDTFDMAAYPVTVAEYALYLLANPEVKPPPSLFFPQHANWVAPTWQGKTLNWVTQQQQRLDHPVVGISWFNARDYALWLARITGQLWCLPTEAEWEKAARGLSSWYYPWGFTWDARRANTHDGGPKSTTPIGMYVAQNDASPYGCHDMVGNVWEWCSSLYKKYPYVMDICENLDDAQNYRIFRGGSWRDNPAGARVAFRGKNVPAFMDFSLGFRLARTHPSGGAR